MKMDKVVKAVVVYAFLLAVGVAWGAVPAPVTGLLKEMRESGTTIQSGFSPELGVYMVGIGRSRYRPGGVSRCREVAELHAKKELAAALGTTLKAHDASKLNFSQKDNESEVEAFVSSLTESSVDQLLKGVQVVSSGRTADGEMEVVVYMASKRKEIDWNPQAQGVVVAVGISVDRGGAERNALRSAVEQVAGTLVVGKVSVNEREDMHKRLATTAGALVEAYRVTKDEKADAEFKVEVMARVNKRKLYESYRSFFKCLDNPVFCIVATDESLGRQFTQFFIDKGFLLTTKPEECHYLIKLDGRFTDRPTPGNDKSMGTILNLNVNVVSVDGKRVLLSMNDKQAKDSAVLSAEQRREETARRILEKLEPRLHQTIHDMIIRLLDDYEPSPAQEKNACTAF